MTAIIDTGCANILSVQAALDRLGAQHVLARDPGEAASCARLVLPGVGTAGAAMNRLRDRGWDTTLQSEARPVLGICLGMQILFESSAEDGSACLGLIPGRVQRLTPPPGAAWPHMGWNQLEFEAGDDPLLDGVDPGGYAYFVHGFAVPETAATLASCGYGARFSAIVRQGNLHGCQFHPERSSRLGARILANFAEMT